MFKKIVFCLFCMPVISCSENMRNRLQQLSINRSSVWKEPAAQLYDLSRQVAVLDQQEVEKENFDDIFRMQDYINNVLDKRRSFEDVRNNLDWCQQVLDCVINQVHDFEDQVDQEKLDVVTTLKSRILSAQEYYQFEKDLHEYFFLIVPMNFYGQKLAMIDTFLDLDHALGSRGQLDAAKLSQLRTALAALKIRQFMPSEFRTQGSLTADVSYSMNSIRSDSVNSVDAVLPFSDSDIEG